MTGTKAEPAKRLTLAEIMVQFQALHALLDETESDGEITPEIAAWLDEYGELEGERLDRYVLFMKSLEIDAAGYEGQKKALSGELDYLRGRERACLNHVGRLKARLHWYMEQREITEMRGSIYRANLQSNGGPPLYELLVPVDQLPAELTVVKVTEDRDAIRAGLLAGIPEVAAVARRIEPGTHVRIR